MAIMKKKESKVGGGFTLPNEKVHVKPVLQEGDWLPDGHSGSFMYDNTSLGLQVPIDSNSGRLRNPLTEEETYYFENESELDLNPGDLNPYKKKDNFWSDFKVVVRKSDSIVTDNTILMTLDLSKPIEYLQYKVLLANSSVEGGLVAPSWNQREDSGTYRIALVRDAEQNIDKVKRADKMKKAYKYLSSIDGSSQEMYDFLTIYYLETKNSKRPSLESNKEYYYSELQTLIDEELDSFVAIVDDIENYEYKLIIHKGLQKDILRLIGKNKIETSDGVPLGENLSQAVSWLKDSKNQTEYLRLRNQVELTEKAK